MDLLDELRWFDWMAAGYTAVSLPAFSWPPEKLVVGVSGGPDSLALLHVLWRLLGAQRLAVAHVNHGLRAEAMAEAQFVAETAVSWHIPFYQTTTDTAALARVAALSLEEAGRQARYHFFAQVAAQVGATAVAVGHNADDQAETVLMHLLRGSGLAGLRGMELVSPMPGAPQIALLRPFLNTPRAEIEAYCQAHRLQPRQDSSNREATFFRNRLRLHLLPLLAEYNPQIQAHLRQLAQVVAADEALLRQLQQEAWQAVVQGRGADWLAFDRPAWLALPLSLRRRVLRQVVWAFYPDWRDVPFRPVEQARLLMEAGRMGVQATLPGGVTLTVEYGRFLFTTSTGGVPLSAPQLYQDAPIPLPVPGEVALGSGWVLQTAVLPAPDFATICQNADPWVAHIPATLQPLYVRPRQPGERFQPLGLNGRSAPLKKVMINRKIPAALRARWPLVATADHPVWLVGYQLDQRASLRATDHVAIQLHCHRAEEITE